MRDAAQSRLAVGFFDGVHRGHQALLRGADAALTFRNHPLTVLAPERAPRLIMDADERIAAMRACGVAEVTVLDFTPEIAALEPQEFLSRYVHSAQVVCGANWRFGRGGRGDAAFLRRQGIAVEVVPYAEHCGEPISSSRIRRCLEGGEVADANAMLGRRFAVRGQRFRGKGVGASIGWPTVNLMLPTLALRLPLGVYEVEMDGLRGLANYGLAPTMGARAWPSPVLEVHLLARPPEVADDTPRTVEFLRFLRPEMRFESLESLQRQIAADFDTIRP